MENTIIIVSMIAMVLECVFVFKIDPSCYKLMFTIWTPFVFYYLYRFTYYSFSVINFSIMAILSKLYKNFSNARFFLDEK